MERSNHHDFLRLLVIMILAVVALSQANPRGTVRDKDYDGFSGVHSVSRSLKLDADQAILCLYVRKVDVMLVDRTGITKYNCLLDSRHTDGAEGLQAEIEGAGDEFGELRESALEEGKPSLYVIGGILSAGKGRLTFQDDMKSSLMWMEAVKDDVLPPSRLGSYKVSGTFSVLVVRIIATDSAPLSTVQELSDANFLLSGVSTATQYLACSGSLVELVAATGTTPGGQTISGGVVEVSVSLSASGNTPEDLTNEVAITLGGADQLEASYDHVVYAIPFGTESGGDTGWGAFADFPGTFSWYDDGGDVNLAAEVDFTLHELGHNYFLDHSSELDEEYGDITCQMGGGSGDSRCFNGAKMAQLEWFEDRTRSVDPFDAAFSGYLIGVNDYSTSLEEHNIVLILPESGQDYQYYFTYNRAEGITAETEEAVDEVLVVTTVPWGERSFLNASLSVGDTYSIEDFAGSGRTLLISVEEMTVVAGSDGLDTIDVASLTIDFEDVQCTADADCDDGNECTTEVCGTASICEYSRVDNCCGNGICEIASGETCSSCPDDCFGDDCSSFELGSDWGYWNDDYVGMMFDVDAVVDIHVYELAFYLVSASDISSMTVSIYTKEGTHMGSESTPSDWQLVADSIEVVGSPTDVFFGIGEALKFSTPITETYISASAKQSFYMTPETTSVVYLVEHDEGISAGSVSYENADMVVYDGVRVAYEFDPEESYYSQVRGTISYGYGALVAPTTPAPTALQTSRVPSTPPSAAPNVLFSPSSAPSDIPTMTPSLIQIKLRNRQFENDSTEWKIVNGTPERICSTGNEYSGECCYMFTGSSSGEVQRIKNKVRDYEGGGQIGDKFQLSFWLKGEDIVKKRDFRIYLKLKGGAGNSNLFCKTSKKGTFDYRKMYCEYEAEESFDEMDVIFEYRGTVGTVYLDRLSLYEVV